MDPLIIDRELAQKIRRRMITKVNKDKKKYDRNTHKKEYRKCNPDGDA